MASLETYDGTPNTGVNAVVASSTGFDTAASVTPGRRGSIGEEDAHVHGGATGSSEGGAEGLVIAGYEDRFIRFFDANSGTSHNVLESFYETVQVITAIRPMHIHNASAPFSNKFAISVT